MMVYFYLLYDQGKVFQIGNRLIHHNHIIFFGLIIIEIFLIISIVLFHSEFDKFIHDTYKDSKVKWWPNWSSFFCYFAILLLIYGTLNINGVIIEQINKDDEITNMKSKQVNPIAPYKNINNKTMQQDILIAVNHVPTNQDDGYESDEEELGLAASAKDVIDLEIDDGDDDDQNVAIIRS